MTFRDDQDALHERIRALEVELEDERAHRRQAEEKLQALLDHADKVQAERAAERAAHDARTRRLSFVLLVLLAILAAICAAFASVRYDQAAEAHRAAAVPGVDSTELRIRHGEAVMSWGFNVAAIVAGATTALFVLLRWTTPAIAAYFIMFILMLPSILGRSIHGLEPLLKAPVGLIGFGLLAYWSTRARQARRS